MSLGSDLIFKLLIVYRFHGSNQIGWLTHVSSEIREPEWVKRGRVIAGPAKIQCKERKEWCLLALKIITDSINLYRFAILSISHEWNHTTCSPYDWLLSLSIPFSRLIHFVPCIIPFLLPSNILLYESYYTLFSPLSVNTHLWCIHICLLWIMVLPTFTYNFLCKYLHLFLLAIHLREFAGSHIHSIFNSVGNYLITSQRSCTMLHSHQPI